MSLLGSQRTKTTVIIDEAHERSLNIDFLLGYLRQLLPRRRDLKIVVTSATIDPHRFSAHFDDAPVIEVSGRTWPVDVRYRPLATDDPDEKDRDMLRAILDAVDELAAVGPGDVLVFLAGEREIREAAEALRKHHPPGTEILPLYARLSAAEQHRVFEPHPGRRIVLATNVAETSLTVPGIRFVADPGRARISRYSARSRVQRLPIEAISQASARQRAGRCGRLGPGVCIRLFDEKDFEQREPYTAPEIQRTNLASVVLRMKALRLGDVASFPFIDPPRRNMIRDGEETLRELAAIDGRGELTEIGRRLARLPVDPRLGRMILAANDEGCVSEVLTIVAALSIQDPRERPLEKRDAADQAHRRFADETSDFLTLLRLWELYHEQKKHLSWNKLRAACRDGFISFVRMREWVDIRRQLADLAPAAGCHVNREAARTDRVHRALLAGLLANVGRRGERGAYDGTRGSTFRIFPGSTLSSRGPKWVMAAEIVETTRRYARAVAPVDPRWIESIGAHLINRSHAEPHWDRVSARVMAFEKVSLFGLEIVARRRVHYGPIAPRDARELFIHHALVEDELSSDAPFLVHNRALVEEIREIEAKRRRRDVLVDPRLLEEFYDRRLPADVYSGRSLAQWRRKAERRSPRLLFMERADLLRPGAEGADPAQFPPTITAGSVAFDVAYRHEPGADDDGVTVTVPLPLIGRVEPGDLEWLVPGLLEEKIAALIKTLPKSLRRNVVPAPDFARACLGRLDHERGGLRDRVASALHRMTGQVLTADAFDPGALPSHLVMRVRVVDEEGRELAAGRDLGELRAFLSTTAQRSFAALADESLARDDVTAWDFGDLPERVEVSAAASTVWGYPALVDGADAVAIQLFDAPEAARAAHGDGVRRLAVLHCRDEIAFQVSHLPGIDAIRIHFAAIGSPAQLERGITTLIARRAFAGDAAAVRTESAFEALVDAGWRRLAEAGVEVASLVAQVLEAHHRVVLALDDRDKPVWAAVIADVREHLSRLMPADVFERTPFDRLAQVPRYLRAVEVRLERLPGGGHRRDETNRASLVDWTQRYLARRAEHERQGIIDPEIEEFRWMLEEMRVSLFAQRVGTAVPISPKRLEAQWARVRA